MSKTEDSAAHRAANTGQAVLVTAAGSGIGRVIAETFHAGGARLHICDVDKAALEDALGANPGMRGTVADVGRPDDVDRLFGEAHDWMGRLDVLVNNAGIGGPRGPVDEISDADWDETMRINLNGAFYCAKRAARIMKQQRSGCIVNISSASAKTGLPNRTAYVTSKVGLQGLMLNLARELGPFNIRSNAIPPGPIDYPRGRALLEKLAAKRGVTVEEALERRLGFVSMRTRIDPKEVADMAVMLASEACRHVSGQLIGVCGNTEWEE